MHSTLRSRARAFFKYWGLTLLKLPIEFVDGTLKLAEWATFHPYATLVIVALFFGYIGGKIIRNDILEAISHLGIVADILVTLFNLIFDAVMIIVVAFNWAMTLVKAAISVAKDLDPFHHHHSSTPHVSIHLSDITRAHLLGPATHVTDIPTLCAPYDSIGSVCFYPTRAIFNDEVCPVARYLTFSPFLETIMTYTVSWMYTDPTPLPGANCVFPAGVGTCIGLGFPWWFLLAFIIACVAVCIGPYWPFIKTLGELVHDHPYGLKSKAMITIN